jgi:hypothetical protein
MGVNGSTHIYPCQLHHTQGPLRRLPTRDAIQFVRRPATDGTSVIVVRINDTSSLNITFVLNLKRIKQPIRHVIYVICIIPDARVKSEISE